MGFLLAFEGKKPKSVFLVFLSLLHYFFFLKLSSSFLDSNCYLLKPIPNSSGFVWVTAMHVSCRSIVLVSELDLESVVDFWIWFCSGFCRFWEMIWGWDFRFVVCWQHCGRETTMPSFRSGLTTREQRNGGGSQANLYLNVYDLTSVNKYLYWFGLGIYHSGIEGMRFYCWIW